MEKLEFSKKELPKVEFGGYAWEKADANKLLDDGNADYCKRSKLDWK